MEFFHSKAVQWIVTTPRSLVLILRMNCYHKSEFTSNTNYKQRGHGNMSYSKSINQTSLTVILILMGIPNLKLNELNPQWCCSTNTFTILLGLPKISQLCCEYRGAVNKLKKHHLTRTRFRSSEKNNNKKVKIRQPVNNVYSYHIWTKCSINSTTLHTSDGKGVD